MKNYRTLQTRTYTHDRPAKQTKPSSKDNQPVTRKSFSPFNATFSLLALRRS